MGFSIYLTDQEITYISGEVKKGQLNIQSCGRFALQVGVLVDGRIVNADLLQEYLLQLKESVSNQPVDVLLDSSAVIVRAMYLPIMSSSKIMAVVKQELQDFVEKNKKYIYDYSVLEERTAGNDEKGRILCTAVEKELLEQYVEAFAAAGMKLHTIDIDKSAQIRLVDHHPILENKTFILCVLDGQTFMASLYVAGKFTYMNEFKIQQQRDNLGLISELSSILATFVQFNKAQRTKHEIRNVYFCGMSDKETSFCQNITNNLGIKCELIPNLPYATGNNGNYALANYLHVTGNLFRK